MRKVFLTTILTLMSTMGVWAKDYAGDVMMGFQLAVGDRIFLNCRVSSVSGFETIHVNYTDDKVSFSQNHTSSWVPINYLNKPEYADYVALNGVSPIDYIAVTKVSKTTTGSLNMNKNYIAPRIEVAHLGTISMICAGSPVPPTPKGDLLVNPEKPTTQVW